MTFWFNQRHPRHNRVRTIVPSLMFNAQGLHWETVVGIWSPRIHSPRLLRKLFTQRHKGALWPDNRNSFLWMHWKHPCVNSLAYLWGLRKCPFSLGLILFYKRIFFFLKRLSFDGHSIFIVGPKENPNRIFGLVIWSRTSSFSWGPWGSHLTTPGLWFLAAEGESGACSSLQVVAASGFCPHMISYSCLTEVCKASPFLPCPFSIQVHYCFQETKQKQANKNKWRASWHRSDLAPANPSVWSVAAL